MIGTRPEGETLVDRATEAFRRYQAGDRAAFDALVEVVSPLMWRVARGAGDVLRRRRNALPLGRRARDGQERQRRRPHEQAAQPREKRPAAGAPRQTAGRRLDPLVDAAHVDAPEPLIAAVPRSRDR